MNTQQFHNKIVNLQQNMMNFALTLTANKEDAQELLQETTLRVLDNQDKYKDNINLKGWVLTIMRNLFINNYHKMVRTHTIVDQSIDIYNLDTLNESGFDSPEESYRLNEVSTAIENLNDEIRLPFTLFVSGYKYHEIAEKMGIPIGTVKSRIFFARQNLQETLKDFRN